MNGVEDLNDGLGLTLRPKNRGLRLTFSSQNGRLLLTFGRQNLRLLDTLCRQDRGAAVTLGAHLLLHRALDGCWRIDRLQLNAVHANTPAPGGLIQHSAQLTVDLVTAGQGLLEVHRTDDVTQSRHRELLNTGDVVRDFVGSRLGVGDLEVDHRVNADHQVVRGDHGLRREGDNLLTQVNSCTHPVNERDQEMKSCIHRGVVASEPLHNKSHGLRHDPHRPRNGGDDEDGQQDHDDNADDLSGFHGFPLV